MVPAEGLTYLASSFHPFSNSCWFFENFNTKKDEKKNKTKKLIVFECDFERLGFIFKKKVHSGNFRVHFKKKGFIRAKIGFIRTI